MAITPDELKISIEPLVQWAEKALDNHIRSSRATSSNFIIYDFPSDFKWADATREVEQCLIGRYEASGWKVDTLSIKYEVESDCRDTTRQLRIKYHFIPEKR
jgi:hypothetical protein